MITVEYDAFSGMPNPMWELNPDEVAEFFRLLPQNLPFVVPVVLAEGTLGFRGMIVRATGLDATRLNLLGLPASIRVFGDPLSGLSDLVSTLVTIPADIIANLLPATTGSEIAFDESSGEEVPDGDGVAFAAAATSCSLAYTDWNNFTFWNGSRKTKNNCYNYAANYASNTDLPGTALDGRALPGRYSGHPLTSLSDSAIRTAMQSDGWKLTCTGTSLKVYAVTGAVLASDGNWYGDFHFYRRNLNSAGANRWCHKPGHTAATNKDASGNYITNPQTADRVGSGFYYNHEVDFFYSPAGTRVVKVK